ncbi:N-acetyltransferase [Terriglobus albidus]|uniref:N-acetyltransferase n=1 Tax=Terriglobus albidus TaxID=1592106 RepID=A0A5B9E493_9BACT|nr:GNAT family N-acetyltransferase [Terriglobus albidus]QEE26778.1 N-acetyltransferase [Terriglobus albidus]
MATEIQVRPVETSDAEAIAEIYGHYVRSSTATFELEPPTVEEIRLRMKVIAEKGLPWLVAEQGGRVVGYAYAGPYRPRAAYRFTLENSVYIHHETAGQGIGRLLMEQLLERCTEWGARQMVAVIGGGDENAASVRLHEKLGFVRVGVLQGVGWKFDRALDSLLMQRGL